MPITERTRRLKERCRYKHFVSGEFVDPNSRAGMERLRFFTESYKSTMGEPEVIRRAKALDHLLRKMTVFIQEDELIIGDHAEHPDWFPLYPELGYFQILDFIESGYIPEGYEDEAYEYAEFWKPLGLQAKGEPFCTEQEMACSYQFTPTEPPTFVNAYTNLTPPYESVLEDGLDKRVKLAEESIEKAMQELSTPPWSSAKLDLTDKIDNWKAMAITGKAVIAWARRYSRLAKIMAENFETDPQRKEELMKISDICYRIPAEPCKGLWDAMQAKWFTFLVTQSLETYSCGYSQKEDDMLYPYYQMSRAENAFQPLTRDEAQELVECERLKVSEHGVAKGRTYRSCQSGANDLLILTLGGLDVNGQDNCNEMTDIILDAAYSIQTNEPSIGFRWHPKINVETKKRVFKCIASGLGFPSIKHEDINTSQLKKYFGASDEEASRWALVLCMSPGISGRRKTQKTRSEGGGGTVNMAKCVELALSDGYDYSFSNMQAGPKTGDPTTFKTYDDLWQAFKKQLEWAVFLAAKGKDISRKMEIRYMPRPFTSLLDDGCMEKGMDAMALQEIPNPWHNTTANILAADSLAAIKKLVFDDKKYTMEELIKALRANWEGYEEMRQDFLAAPKFGNDIDYVDNIARDVYHAAYEEMQRHPLYAGKPALPLPQSVALFTMLAPRVGALPSGRKHGEVLDDGGISPYIGSDRKGPTAVLKSVSKVNHRENKGTLLNQRLNAEIMRGPKGFELWNAYMDTWYKLDIDHIQFNVQKEEELRAAQVEPEKYPNLAVRIAGYSAKFVDLTEYTQNAILARTVQDLGN